MVDLLKACPLLKHRLLIGLCYGCGLRCAEVRNLRIGDVDTTRAMIHVHQGKGKKDRILPMGTMLARGIRKYIDTEVPRQYLFEGNDGNIYSQRGAQWAISEAVKKAGIAKQVTLHTLRHTYATHLLEQGVNILPIRRILICGLLLFIFDPSNNCTYPRDSNRQPFFCFLRPNLNFIHTSYCNHSI